MPLSTDRVADTAKAFATFAKSMQNAHKAATELLAYNATQAITWTPATKVFTATIATDVLAATAHGLLIGQKGRVTNSGGALPAPLLANTDYFLTVVNTNDFKLATSLANALAGTPIDITTTGTGTHTFNPVPDYIVEDAFGNISGLSYSRIDVSNAIGSVQEFVDLMNNATVSQGDHLGNLNKLATAPT